MIKLNYKEFGLGEPVIILHGLFGTLDNWQTVAKKLSDDFTVYILDLRNHGRSPQTDDEYTYMLLADDLAHFIEQHRLNNVRLIGHSMGGKAAMQFALNYPEYVKQLVVVDIAPKQYRRGHDEIFKALLSLDLTTIDDRKEAEAALTKELKEDVGTIQFLLKNLSRRPQEEGGGFEWKINLDVLHRDYDKHILAALSGEPYDKPTLFVRGGQSRYIQDSDISDIKQLFPQSEVVTIDDAGHWVHAEKPQELLSILRNFFQSF